MRRWRSAACGQQQGRHGEADALLRPVCDWFTAGLDEIDLREARSLLDALRQSA